MTNRLLVIVFSFLFTFLGFFLFCAEARAESELRASALERARARGELRWGADAQGGAPYVFQDPMDPNHLIGFEVEIAEAIAQKIGLRARHVQSSWEGLLEVLERGDVDVVLNGIEVAEEKKRVSLLSRAYYVAPLRLSIRRGDKAAPRALSALQGRMAGTLPTTLAERILRREGALVKTYDGGQDDIFADLKLGRSDAVLLDSPITKYYGEIDPAFETVPGDFGKVSYAVAIQKDDTAMLEAINHAIAELLSDGTFAVIYARWGLYNEDLTPLVGARAPTATPEAFDAWRAAVEKPLPFFARAKERYPAALPVLGRGAFFTLLISLASMTLAILLGLPIALARSYGPRPIAWIAGAYIELFRGTPLLIQLTMVYFGLPELGINLHPFAAGCLALGLNYAAAEAENYRAGLGSVPLGQLEAARVLGLSRLQAIRYVAAPQALRVALPPMTNDFIALLKDSSLVSIVTLTELTKSYLNLASSMRDHLGLGAVVAILYLLLSLPFARLARAVEARMGQRLGRVV